MDLYTYLGVTKDELTKIVSQKSRLYVTYRIKKHSGKFRRIDAPQEPLKSTQRLLVYKILYLFKPHKISYGFVRDRNPIDNARMHVGKKHIINVDIKDFFPSITYDEVLNTLKWILALQKKFTYTPEDVVLLAELLTYNKSLPQGAPTSPPMSNIVCIYLDQWLNNIQESKQYKNKIVVTRYCDDITVSTNETKELHNILRNIMECLRETGFRANKQKVKIRSSHQRMEVTGIVVNQKPNIRKTKWKILRATLHNILHGKRSITDLDIMRLRGQIEWVRSLNPNRGTKLLKQLSLIIAKQSIKPSKISN